MRYYLFMVELGRCNGSCNTLEDPSLRICIANKTEGINLNVFNVITIVNDSKILTKYTSCKRKCKFVIENVIQIKSETTINADASAKTEVNIMSAKKAYMYL